MASLDLGAEIKIQRRGAIKQSKDPFEAAYVEEEESPPESPIVRDDYDTQSSNVVTATPDYQSFVDAQDDDEFGRQGNDSIHPSDNPSTSRPTMNSAWVLSFQRWLLLMIQIKCQRAF
ncbi:hypothetical protein SADUNF_Sadunf05G0083600 [Salix dunnii]|uniref:Uncharacterized protein n=1 Tax=Salix dunnii TaxID=1413687 RepID=A0A835K7P4_9ROSI|nr:hypothetical protein SADUNF_Sadunf05G0083600 [Salix dunnii]